MTWRHLGCTLPKVKCDVRKKACYGDSTRVLTKREVTWQILHAGISFVDSRRWRWLRQNWFDLILEWKRKLVSSVRYPRWPREPTALSGVFPLLPGPYPIGISHFPETGGFGVLLFASSLSYRPLVHNATEGAVSGLYLSSTERLPRCSHMDAILRFFLWYCYFLRTEPVCSVGRAFRDIFSLLPWLHPLPLIASQTKRSLN